MANRKWTYYVRVRRGDKWLFITSINNADRTFLLEPKTAAHVFDKATAFNMVECLNINGEVAEVIARPASYMIAVN